LAETLELALSQDYADYEVIVVDQSREIPQSVTERVLESQGRARYLRMSPPNLPGARNLGVRAAKGDIVVFIDDDVRIANDYLTQHARYYVDPQVGAVMGLTVPVNGNPAMALKGSSSLFGIRAKYAGETVSVSWVLGGNTSYRKAAVVAAGMSDERFTENAWSEDADLAVRVRHLGYRLLWDPKIKLIHLEIPQGGCCNRNTEQEETRCRLYLFFCLKNRAILGRRMLARNIWQTYRQYAFNTVLLRSWKRAIRGQLLFARCIYAALRMCPTKRRQTFAGSL
jgi:glycosyltransferase involved in cell wall biosynthesis